MEISTHLWSISVIETNDLMCFQSHFCVLFINISIFSTVKFNKVIIIINVIFVMAYYQLNFKSRNIDYPVFSINFWSSFFSLLVFTRLRIGDWLSSWFINWSIDWLSEWFFTFFFIDFLFALCPRAISLQKLVQQVLSLKPEEQMQVFNMLQESLRKRGLLRLN